MNIFALDRVPGRAAQMHCDKHVVKMLVEYAQLLSTAHRMLAGQVSLVQWVDAQGKSRKRTVRLLPGETYGFNDNSTKLVYENALCYAPTHANHPCAVWARESDANYSYLFQLWMGLHNEYTHRYGKVHASAKFYKFLMTAPKSIPRTQQTPFPQAMPPQYMVPNDSIAAYQAFYVGIKSRFARWTEPAEVPKWFITGLKEKYDASRFARKSRVVQCSDQTPRGDDR